MDLYEYQGKQLFAEVGVPVPRSWMIHPDGPDPAEIVASLGLPLVAKAQVLSGGRGKAGGVREVRTRDEVLAAVAAMSALTIRGRKVAGVLLEEQVEIEREFYLAFTVDRQARRPLLLFSTKGGMDIEEVARTEPQALFRHHIDPLTGLDERKVRELVVWAGLTGRRDDEFAMILRELWRLFCSIEATLLEVNPLVLVADGHYLALDAKVSVDDNALFRHPTLLELAGENETDERARRAREDGFRYVELEGDIGVLGNGAGLVMSTLDQIAAAGGRPADFLDMGGGARSAQIAAALDLVLSDRRAKALLVNVFGGITRCDEVARGLIEALRDAATRLPVVVRLDGNNAQEGREILAAAGLPQLVAAPTAWDAVQRVVALAGGGSAAAAPASPEPSPELPPGEVSGR